MVFHWYFQSKSSFQLKGINLETFLNDSNRLIPTCDLVNVFLEAFHNSHRQYGIFRMSFALKWTSKSKSLIFMVHLERSLVKENDPK